MSNDELERKIRKWLDQGGYPLEMRVARAFEQSNFRVTTSKYYKDIDEDNSPFA